MGFSTAASRLNRRLSWPDLGLLAGERYFDSLSFEGGQRMRGTRAGERWEWVRPVSTGPDGVQYVERDFWIRN